MVGGWVLSPSELLGERWVVDGWVTFFRASGWRVSSKRVQVRTAAEVSCPAISMVMRSSLSCTEVLFSPLMSTKNL